MNITTLYDLGQTVVPISLDHKTKWQPCLVCDGTGHTEIKGEEYLCPVCGGSAGKRVADGVRFTPRDPSVIGKVDVEIYEQEYVNEFGGASREVKYMLRSTGVGSGMCWYESDLFPTQADAVAACDERTARMQLAGVCGDWQAAVQWLREERINAAERQLSEQR